MRKTVLLPILTIVFSSVILLGLYNGLSGIRQANIESELQTKMETLLPGSTSFQQETYDGEDSSIRTVYRGITAMWSVYPSPAMSTTALCWLVSPTRAASPDFKSVIWKKPTVWAEKL